MNFQLIPSSVGLDRRYQFLNTYLFDDVLAVDAGCLGIWGDLDAQAQVRDIVFTHTHADHVASLPMFLENTYGRGPTVVAHGSATTLDSIRRDIFNDRIFPDLLTRQPEPGPFLLLSELLPLSPRRLTKHTVTIVPVNHAVPTDAVLVESDDAAVLIVTDTGPTEAVWKFATTVRNLKMVLLEVSFPESLRWLADLAGHLTPKLFAIEAAKVAAGVPILTIHMKPHWRDAIATELAAFELPHVTAIEPGRIYSV